MQESFKLLYVFLHCWLRVKDLVIFELKNKVYAKTTPTRDLRAPGIENLGPYAQMNIFVGICC